MRLAIVFWFYKEFDLCAGRLRSLRKLNPGVPIYGLYGGELEGARAAADRLGPLLDDLFVFSEPRDSHWKWLNGDQVIAAWMRERGSTLPWDTVVLVQWDMLVAAPLTEVFEGLGAGEAVLSGFRPLAETADWWGWAGGRDPEKRTMLTEFTDSLRRDWDYDGPLWCCLFIVVCLPRAFLARYAAQPLGAGFLEYKIPTLARVWGVPVRMDFDVAPWWAADPSTREAPARERVLNAVGAEVSWKTLTEELGRADGRRVFHPYGGPLPAELL